MVVKRKPPEHRLIPRDYIPPGARPHGVKTGESLKSIAATVGWTWQELTQYNWKTRSPPEVNWYLGEYLGCRATTPDGDNYSFRTGDGPLYLPKGRRKPHPVTRHVPGDKHRSTIRRVPPPTLVVKVPLGLSEKFSKSEYTVGKIYVPTKWGGTLKVTPSTGRVSLHYKDGKDSTAVIDAVRKDKFIVAGPASPVEYTVPKDKHGWYLLRCDKPGSVDISNTFEQKGEAQHRPWNGWYCPTEPNTNPNLYEDTGDFTPLKKYDQKFGKSSRTWEAANHVGTLGWEGHCWGWSLACIAKRSPKAGSAPFTSWEIRALYTELADNGNWGWTWKIGTPSASIPSGPVSDALGQGPDKWVKTFHDGIRKWIRERKRAMNADLRSKRVVPKWKKVSGVIQPMSGVAFDGANSASGITVNLIWNATASTLAFHDGSPVPVPGDGSYELQSSIGTLRVNVSKAALPAGNTTKAVILEVEVWNHAMFKSIAKFKEETNDQHERYVEIETTIEGNKDTPWPPSETSTVSRKFTYRLKYNKRGDTTKDKANWMDCHGALPPSCLGIVKAEAAFNWRSPCGVTKAGVDSL